MYPLIFRLIVGLEKMECFTAQPRTQKKNFHDWSPCEPIHSCRLAGGVDRGRYAPRNDKVESGVGGFVLMFGHILLRCHCEPVRAWQSSRGRYVGCRGDAGVAERGRLDCRVGALPLLAMTMGETYARASLAWLGPAPPWAKARFAPPCLSPRPSSFRP